MTSTRETASYQPALIAASPARQRVDVLRPLGWCVAGPALALWPFLSVLPLFEMLAGEPGLVLIATRMILLATGFWAVAVAYGFYRFALAGRLPPRRRDGRLAVGLYAAGWTALYLLVFLLA